MFQNPVDISNRGLQHCGISRIADFTEDSKAAQECAFVYDKLRRAELRRNVWQFSIRRTAIRPIASTTMVLNPELWASTTTYGFGAIVEDTSGYLWQSRAQDNLNNAPGNSSAWEAYCGPMTVTAYDSTEGYFTGEMVYQTPGDGTYLVFMSLQSANTQDPRVPTGWANTTTYIRDAVVRYYAAWAIGTTYAAGATITYNTLTYVSLAGTNVGHQPDTATTWWAVVAATPAPAYYSSLTAYTPGTFVTYLGVNYVCILAGTAQTPSTSPTYWVAQAAGTYYANLIDFNLNNNPASAPALWVADTIYATGNAVGGSDGMIYTSVGNGNVGNDPVADNGTNWTNTLVLNPWTTVNPFGNAADQWVQLAVYLTDLQIAYPIGSGPVNQSYTRNVFRLPANFLRRAPQDPKAGSVSYLGAPSGLMYDDWLLEKDCLVSREAQPIVLRFVADITDVTQMDDMFCEGLGARIGLEVCEILTQSTAKLSAIGAMYKQFMTDARLVNGIETSADEPPVDDWISCRI